MYKQLVSVLNSETYVDVISCYDVKCYDRQTLLCKLKVSLFSTRVSDNHLLGYKPHEITCP